MYMDEKVEEAMNPVSSTYFCTITSSEEDTSMDPTEKDAYSSGIIMGVLL